MTLIGLLVFSVLIVTDYLIFGYQHTVKMIPSAIGMGLTFALLTRFGILDEVYDLLGV